jgi:hypothetical protein
VRLSFNVLWVEDQPSLVMSQARAIAVRMEEHGFEFEPVYCRTLAEVRERVADDVFRDDVDLILVDWDLGSGVRGQDVISEIRDSIHYKDVVFYSAMQSASVLRQHASAAGLEGTYSVTRQELVSEVIGVFEALVKKVLDLDHTRGIVMGATCDIDFMVEESLTRIDALLDEPGRERLVKKAVKQVEKKMKDLTSALTRLKGANSIVAVLEAQTLVTAYDRLRLLNHALKEGRLQKHKDHASSVKKYMDEVVPHRNILGHQILKPDGKPVAIQDNKGREITVEETRTLRRVLLTLRKDFRRLLDALRGES